MYMAHIFHSHFELSPQISSISFLPLLKGLILNRLPTYPHTAFVTGAYLLFQRYVKPTPTSGPQCLLCPMPGSSSPIVYCSGLPLNITSKWPTQTALSKIMPQPLSIDSIYFIFLLDFYQSHITFVLFVDTLDLIFTLSMVST